MSPLIATDLLPAADLHQGFAEAFADYLAGPFNLPLSQWPVFLARQGVDLSLGRALLDESGRVQSFALVAPRPALGRWRLATMGAVPAARGRGGPQRLLHDLLQRAEAAGQQALELEVFAQNLRALRLYQGLGFQIGHGLYGHRLEAGPVRSAPASLDADIEIVSVEQAEHWLLQAELRMADLPLQVGAAALAPATRVPGLQVWRRGAAQLVFVAAQDTGLVLRSLVDGAAGLADARVLVQALLASHPGAAVQVPALQRDDLGGAVLGAFGFQRQALHQWWMSRPLRAVAAAG